MKEIWRTVEGYENYEISNKNGFRNKINGKKYNGCIKKGRKYVSVGKNGPVLYNVLVAKAFPEICGEWFEGCDVHHKDFNKLNNVPENLTVMSKSEHHKLHYKYANRKIKKQTQIVQLTLEGNVVRYYEYLKDAEKYGFLRGNVCSCCKGKLKTAYGYKWQYAVND